MASMYRMAMLVLTVRVVLADNCTSSPYTTQNGLSFKTYCKQDMPLSGDSGCQQLNGCDLGLVKDLDSMQDCMEACSRSSQRCYGVSYSSSQKLCYLKGILSDPSYLSDSEDWSSAIANLDQLNQPSDVSCPTSKELKATSGMPFTVFCNADFGIPGRYCTSSQAPCTYHTNSLQECVEHCATARPLCKGVSYNPDMQEGFPNCHLIKDTDTSNVSTPSGYVMHSARIADDVFHQLNTSTPSNLNYTSSDGTTFELIEGDSRSGATNFTSSHAVSVGQCADRCASSNQTCNGVLFDQIIDNGYSNCYLLSDTGSANPCANMTFAQLTKAAARPSDLAQTSSSPPVSSKAWIAGPVVAVVVMLAAIAGFFIWRQRQQHRLSQRYSSYGKVYGKVMMVGDEEATESDGSSPFTPVGMKSACESSVYGPQELPGYITPKSRR